MNNNLQKNQAQKLYLIEKNPYTDNILTIDEVSLMLKVKSSTLRTWINRKKIPDSLYKKIGGTIRFSRKAVLDFLNA